MDLFQKYRPQIETFVNVCHRLARRTYVTGSGGNLAWKLEDNLIIITPTQMYKGDITFDDVVFINLNGDTLQGKNRPTGEKPMYLRFFNQRPDIKSVIHCHPPYAGAMAIMKGKNWLARPYYPETTTEVGPVAITPYAEPLTEQLAENFLPFLQKYNNFIMENHGLVSMTPDTIEWTVMMVELLETSAQSIFIALSTGAELKEIPRQELKGLDNVMKTRNLPLFGAPGVNNSLDDLYY